jgi:hypothetical protein
VHQWTSDLKEACGQGNEVGGQRVGVGVACHGMARARSVVARGLLEHGSRWGLRETGRWH